MLTVEQLLQLTPHSVRRRATSPHFEVHHDAPHEDGRNKFHAIVANVRLYNPDASHDAYEAAIKNYGSKKKPTDLTLKADSRVWVHCECPYFTYYLEYVLEKSGSTDRRHAWNSPPDVRNPRHVPYVCKHLFALMLFLLARAKSSPPGPKSR